MFIFLIYSQALCWGNILNSNVTMKFAQLHYFFSQNIGWDNYYYVPHAQKLGKTTSPVPALNSVPAVSGLLLDPVGKYLPQHESLRKKIFMSRLGCFLDNFWPLSPNLASCFSCCQYFSRYLQYYIYFSLHLISQIFC